MSLWKIAWRSIQQRSLASALTAVSMGLGVALVVAVLVIQSVVYQAFHRGGEGYNLIVGPNKGTPLDIVLTSVFFIGQPRENIPYSYYKELHDGDLSTLVDLAVPICLGDKYDKYRVVGTVPEIFELKYLGDQEYQFAAGENFKAENHFEAVIGATVAEKTGLGVGDTFRPSHDLAAGEPEHEHEKFHVVGVLAPSGTPFDKVLFINIEGFYRVGGHTAGAKEHHAEHEGEHEHEHEHAAVPDKLKRVSAVLIRTDDRQDPLATLHLARKINEGKTAQAAIPAREIEDFFTNIIGNIELVLLLFGVMVVLVAGIGIMVSIYNSMSDRRHEIAIMRSLGASRGTIMAVILLESILLSLCGGVLGLGLGHGLVALAGPTIAEKMNLSMDLLQFHGTELALIPGLIALASLVGYLPALAAYRTDVARSLTSNV